MAHGISVDEKLKRLLKCFIACYIHKYENNNKDELLSYLRCYCKKYEKSYHPNLQDYLKSRKDEYGKYNWELVRKICNPVIVYSGDTVGYTLF